MSLSKVFKSMGSNPAKKPSASKMWLSMASSKGGDRGRSRSPKREQANVLSERLESFDSVEQIFSLQKHMVICVQEQLGKEVCDKAFMKLQDSVVATTFSGCGFTEISLMALAAAGETTVNFGPCVDWDKSCQKVLQALHPTRCCFGDISDIRTLKPAWCVTHDQKCKPSIPKLRDERKGFRIEVAGPCCPPWSAFGKHLGTEDDRYQSHLDWQSKVKKDKPDIVIFENVSRYDPELLQQCFGRDYSIKVAKLDPSHLWQVPMARPRLYFILYLKKTCRWVGPEGDDWANSMPVKIPPSDSKLDLNMLAKTLSKADQALGKRPMTSSEAKHFKLYQEAVKQGNLRPSQVWDLSQNPQFRACADLVDGSLMTLRRNCGSIYLLSSKKFFTPCQLMRMMGWPMCDEDREALSLPDVQMPDGISDRQLCSMAGNAMFGPCCAMAIFAALLYVERIS